MFVSLPNDTRSTWVNVDASRARGVEGSVEARPHRFLSLAANYTRLDSRVTRSSTASTPVGQELLRRPKHSAATPMTFAARGWLLQAGAVLMGERQDQDGVGFGLTRNAGYQNVYAGGSYRLNKHVTPILRIENLLNSRYQEVLGYSSLSRMVRGGVRLEW